MSLDPETVLDKLARYKGVVPTRAWGEWMLAYNPGNHFPRGTYFATIKLDDGENDKASRLKRDNVWRLNFGPLRSEFVQQFGQPPARPGKGAVIEGPWDFTSIDQLMPHPVYGWMSWMCVLCPTASTLEELEPLLVSAHGRAKATFDKRTRKRTEIPL
ncbi:MAG: DUF6194 family protein [Pseudomonadota bacterium]